MRPVLPPISYENIVNILSAIYGLGGSDDIAQARALNSVVKELRLDREQVIATLAGLEAGGASLVRGLIDYRVRELLSSLHWGDFRSISLLARQTEEVPAGPAGVVGCGASAEVGTVGFDVGASAGGMGETVMTSLCPPDSSTGAVATRGSSEIVLSFIATMPQKFEGGMYLGGLANRLSATSTARNANGSIDLTLTRGIIKDERDDRAKTFYLILDGSCCGYVLVIDSSAPSLLTGSLLKDIAPYMDRFYEIITDPAHSLIAQIRRQLSRGK
ncbi:MAG: hypothetical protein QG604_821 [Candidatus Dependentiae bacterium]|nr:hypothetical protein [Candidatus Dependentiae bacterium]